MPRPLTKSDLEAYLDEELAPEEMAGVEQLLRKRPELGQRLTEINARRDAGIHSLGEIWRRHRASCPTREQLGSFLLGAVSDDLAEYIHFHVQTVGCRYCLANLDDLKAQQEEKAETVSTRRQKYFQSSAGYLRKT
jgi:anti-sigma factor RsiW